MPDATLSDAIAPTPDAEPARAREATQRTGSVLALLAGLALAANCLLSSPPRFSEAHLRDTSLLRPVVEALGLWGLAPTERGVEVRQFIFTFAAALFVVLAATHVARHGMSGGTGVDDLLDVRRHATDPFFWWIVLLAVSAVSSMYSHAPAMSSSAMLMRVYQAAWWMPLAALLSVRDAKRVTRFLLVTLVMTAGLGVWYFIARVYPDQPSARLKYPMGNELWLAACLLPGVFLTAGLLTSRPAAWGRTMLYVLAAVILLTALVLTKSRSAAVGAAAGVIVLAAVATTGMVRRLILLAAVLSALAGAMFLRQAMQESVGASRTDSIRSRLHYEWPYALHLFLQKPVAGHGEGGYAMLAGRLAREDQLDEPSLMRFDEWSWIAHAHNEYLEILADLGLAGLLAWLAALAVTLWRAVRFIDSARPWQRGDRALAMGLTGALVAMAFEQVTDPAIREPGLPPVFLTVWALLWAVIRRECPLVSPVTPVESTAASQRIHLTGLVLLAAGGLLGYYAVQDWRGARSRHEASRAMQRSDYPAAAREADFAGTFLLDPFQRTQARMIAVWARSLDCDRRLNETESPDSTWLKDSEDALRRLIELDRDVPRFLRVSRLAADLHLNRARAFARLGKPEAEAFSQQQFASALLQNLRDEPFLPDRVAALWHAMPQASSLDRLTWLRGLLRAGDMPPVVVELMREMPSREDFGATLNDLYAVAQRDAARPPPWQDRLAPETYRLAALAKSLADRPRESIDLVAAARGMYARAGARLFAGHAAAVHEEVRYRLAVDPAGDLQAKLELLAEAARLRGVHSSANDDLTHELGWTRLVVLVAARAEDAAASQARQVAEDRTVEQTLARAHLEAALLHAARPEGRTDAFDFAETAARLDPSLLQAWLVILERSLEDEAVEKARAAARQFIERSTDADAARRYLSRYRERFPAPALWNELGVPPSPEGPAASAPAR